MLVSNLWSKLKKDFYDSNTKNYNISKIPEIYDTIRHDLRKNVLIFDLVDPEVKDDIHQLAKMLAYFVVINEYGLTDDERIQVGKDICLPLLEKILIDLMFWSEKTSEDNYWKYRNQAEIDNWRHIRTRLYFTSASHMYSLLNILTLGNDRELLRHSPVDEAEKVFNILYMGYLSHIEFRLYENLTMSEDDHNRFRMQISFSTEYKKAKKMKEFSLGGRGFTINEVSEFIQSFLPVEGKSLSNSKDISYSLKKV